MSFLTFFVRKVRIIIITIKTRFIKKCIDLL